MTPRIHASAFPWLNLVGDSVPPRNPNNGDEEDEEDEDEDREPAVIREPDEDEQGEKNKLSPGLTTRRLCVSCRSDACAVERARLQSRYRGLAHTVCPRVICMRSAFRESLEQFIHFVILWVPWSLGEFVN